MNTTTIMDNALQTYHANLTYLEKYHKVVFDKITLLSHLIEEGIYQQKYVLEYKDEGYFDILELCSNTYLYCQNSLLHSHEISNLIDLRRTGAIFLAQRLVYADEEDAKSIDASDLTFHNNLWAIIQIVNYVKRYTPPESHMINVNKIIFLSLGLGLHLSEIIKKLHARVVFLKEKNIEIFRLSLFVTNYEHLSQDSFLHFSITDDEAEERENFINFLNHGNNYNLFMKHIPFTSTYEPELKRLQNHVLSQSYISYGYSAKLLRHIDSPRYMVQSRPFLNISQFYTNSPFKTNPVLFLFSGPSTLKNIEWIHANKHKFILVSALSTCKLLNTYNIIPHFVIHIDPGEDTALLFENWEYTNFFTKTNVILAANVDPLTVAKLENAALYFVDTGTNTKRNFGTLSSPSVGEYSYALFLLFGVHQLFLLGLDLALDQSTLQSHGGYHPYQTIGIENTENTVIDSHKTVEYVSGNFTNQVPTLPVYKQSINQFEVFTRVFKKDYHHVYNLSTGALLEGAVPLHIHEYDWNSLLPLPLNINHILENFLISISSNEFTQEDRAWIQYQIHEAKKLEKIIRRHEKKKYHDATEYLSSVSKLSIDLSDMEYKSNSDLAQVYYEFFLIINSYIHDLFNTRELTNPLKHITEVDQLLVRQLLKISQTYLKKMQSYLM